MRPQVWGVAFYDLGGQHSVTLAAFTAALPPRLIPFLGVGSVGFVVDAGLTLGLSGLGFDPFVARLPAAALAIGTTFALNRSLTFRSRERGVARQFGRYLLVNAFGATANVLAFTALLAMAPDSAANPVWRVAAALVVGTGVGLVFNYLGSRHFAFRPARALARETANGPD